MASPRFHGPRSDESVHRMSPVEALIDWILRDGRNRADLGAFLADLAPRLVSIGVPVDRMTFGSEVLHPDLSGTMWTWRSDTEIVDQFQVGRGILESGAYLNSPMAVLDSTGQAVRARVNPDGDQPYPIVTEWAEEGGTDYWLLPFPGEMPGILGANNTSLATKAAGGFTAEHEKLIERVLPAIGAVSDLFNSWTTTHALLDTYVGPATGAKILAGGFTANNRERIGAVILFADMRDFAGLTESVRAEAVHDTLNAFFTCLVTAVHAQGGEVLSFMGDGLLAIFVSEDDSVAATEDAAARSLIASHEAFLAVDGLNFDRRAEGARPIDAGISLHIGSVLYGNLGGAGRYGYTVIGSAVNRAARIERLCRTLKRRILTSAEFADACPVLLDPLGAHTLRGIQGDHPIYAPRFDESALGDV